MIKRYALPIILVCLGVLTYIRFQNYQPKLLKQLQEVKGIVAVKPDMLPYPLESTKIAETKTETTEHVTIQTTADHIKVKNFYENILLEKEWKIESQETNSKFSILKFKRGNQTINIISSLEKDDADKTIVSIEINKDN